MAYDELPKAGDREDQKFCPNGIFAHTVGNGIGFLSRELGEARNLLGYQTNPSPAVLATRLSRSIKLKEKSDDDHEKVVKTIVKEVSAPFRFSDMAAELRDRVYFFHAVDRGNTPSNSITLGHTINNVYHHPKGPFPFDLNVTLVSTSVRKESLAIIGKELAPRSFYLTHHDQTMLRSPVEKAMLPVFGPYIQKLHLSRGGLFRCLQVLPAASKNLKTIDVQLSTHPRYAHRAVNYEFPKHIDEDAVETLLKRPKDLMQRRLNESNDVKTILLEYRNVRDMFPDVFPQDRQWKVRFIIRVYMRLNDDTDSDDESEEDGSKEAGSKDDGSKVEFTTSWRHNVTFEADTGKVVEVVRLPRYAMQRPVQNTATGANAS